MMKLQIHLCIYLPFPGMIGYGMAKAAVHHLVRSLACDKSGLPADAFVSAISPYVVYQYYISIYSMKSL